MSIKKQVKKTINSLLKPFNYRMTMKGLQHFLVEEHETTKKLYHNTIEQIQGYYSTFIDEHYKFSPKRNKLLQNLLGTEISEALHIVTALRETSILNGDVCEFGVAQGRTSALICNEIIRSSKKIWFFDSFAGLSVPTIEDELIDDVANLGTMEAYAGSMASPESMLRESISKVDFPLDRVRILRGFIDDTLQKGDLPISVSFAFVDFDLYAPIRDTLFFLNEVINEGGIIIVDDYDFLSSGVKKAVDEFYFNNISRFTLIVPSKYLGNFAILKRR
jgi:O-methyltransferase